MYSQKVTATETTNCHLNHALIQQSRSRKQGFASPPIADNNAPPKKGDLMKYLMILALLAPASSFAGMQVTSCGPKASLALTADGTEGAVSFIFHGNLMSLPIKRISNIDNRPVYKYVTKTGPKAELTVTYVNKKETMIGDFDEYLISGQGEDGTKPFSLPITCPFLKIENGL
jgi:hypothetical protein